MINYTFILTTVLFSTFIISHNDKWGPATRMLATRRLPGGPVQFWRLASRLILTPLLVTYSTYVPKDTVWTYSHNTWPSHLDMSLQPYIGAAASPVLALTALVTVLKMSCSSFGRSSMLPPIDSRGL